MVTPFTKATDLGNTKGQTSGLIKCLFFFLYIYLFQTSSGRSCDAQDLLQQGAGFEDAAKIHCEGCLGDAHSGAGQ